MNEHTPVRPARTLLLMLAAGTLLVSCGRNTSDSGMMGSADAAVRTYVAPGSHDEMYLFCSGGFSGNVSVYGIPSGRHLKDIPVFSQYPEKGWGYAKILQHYYPGTELQVLYE